jgi:uncharacterized protein (DUF362 family)
MPVEVAIAHDDHAIESAIDSALQSMDLEALVRGRVVAVKPNDTWASPEDQTGVTQADTLASVLRHLKRFDPARLIVTGGAGAAETEDVFQVSGMMEALRREGAEFFDHNRPPFKTVSLPGGPISQVVVSSRVLEYQTLISLAQLKLHETATVTLALKNIAMSFPAADHYGHPRGSGRGHVFFGDMHRFIVAMAQRFPISLAIIVGHPAMVATGPLGGLAVETGLVVASRDAIAADAVGARLLGFEPQGVRYLWEAARMGLGQTDFDQVRFPLLSLSEAIRIFTHRAYGRELTFEHA